ncbi:MAG: bile acid:sodium symporter family protein [Pseudomonadota bacterium]
MLEIFLPLSLAFIMFSLGLGLTVADFRRVAEVPRAVVAGLVAQVLLLPLAAFTVVSAFGLPPELGFGVMILSLCPGGVTSNILTKLAGGTLALSITLTAVVSLVSVVSLPALTALMAMLLLAEAAPPVDIGALAIAMVLITALPVLLGLGLRHWLPGMARVEPWVARLANILFLTVVVVAIVEGWGSLSSQITVLGPALVTLILGLLGAGAGVAILLRLERRERIAISLETGVQNATMGITVGTLVAGSGSILPDVALPSAVYGVLMYLVVAPFILWWRQT